MEIDVSKCPYGCKYDKYCSLYEDDCYDYMDCDYRQLQQYKQCLDEIEKILQEYHPLFVNTPLYMIDKVIRQIKEVKGNR